MASSSLELVGGDRYCVQFGADGTVINKDSQLFKVRRPKLEGCPGGGPTTTSSTAPVTTTTTSSTTTTTMYSSPSRAFLDAPTRSARLTRAAPRGPSVDSRSPRRIASGGFVASEEAGTDGKAHRARARAARAGRRRARARATHHLVPGERSVRVPDLRRRSPPRHRLSRPRDARAARRRGAAAARRPTPTTRPISGATDGSGRATRPASRFCSPPPARSAASGRCTS